jgi:hypothetical protein
MPDIIGPVIMAGVPLTSAKLGDPLELSRKPVRAARSTWRKQDRILMLEMVGEGVKASRRLRLRKKFNSRSSNKPMGNNARRRTGNVSRQHAAMRNRQCQVVERT